MSEIQSLLLETKKIGNDSDIANHVLKVKETEKDLQEDVTSQDPNLLAIPKHRIQYFKFFDKIAWDKTKRLGLVFGSTGSGKTILDFV